MADTAPPSSAFRIAGPEAAVPLANDAAALARIARTLQMIKASNRALIHATEEQRLLDDICRIAVDAAGYRLAWVGYAEQDDARSVRPVAIGGPHADYVEKAQVSWADNPRGRGPTGTCIREGRTITTRDFTTDPHMTPWRANAAEAGFRSSVAIPLRSDDAVFGAFTIYSGEPAAFDERETALLEELAADLAYGVNALRTRAAHEVAAAEVRRNEVRYRSLVEALNDGLVEVDGEHRIVFTNAQFAELLGREPRDLIGHQTLEFMDDEERRVVLQRTLRSGATGADRYELTWRRSDGASIPTLVSVRRRFDELGRYMGSISAVTDVTELKRAEKEREQYLKFFRLSTDAMAIADPFGCFVRVNPAMVALTGYAEQELVSKPFLDFVTPEDRQRTADEMKLQVSVRPSMQFENRYLRKDGSIIDLSWTAYFDGSEGVTYATARDVTERKRIESELDLHRRRLEELVEARTAELATVNQELESFAYSVSHDLRAPLRAIDGFSQVLVEDHGAKLDADGQHIVAVIRESAQKMSQMIEDILAFSRAGQLELKVEPVDMDALVRTVWEELRLSLAGRSIQFQAGALPQARGDEAMLHRVWQNLLDNAIKYTGPKSDARIEVGARPGDGEIVYFVRDNGVGFDMAYVDKLWGVFQRRHGAEIPGSGIGLAIVKRIVTRQGGRVWAEGKAGEGATFYFTIPTGGAP